MAYKELTSAQLRRTYAVHNGSSALKADDTDLHQPRALQALDFGMRMSGPGYNVYALGGPRTGMREFVLSNLHELAAAQPVANDLCYVANLEKPSEPISIELPAGMGKRLREDIKLLLSNLATTIKTTFNSDEFRNQMNEILDALRLRQESDNEELRKEALAMGLVMLPTPSGFAFAPQKNGKVMSNEEMEQVSEEESAAYSEAMDTLTEKLRSRLMEYPAFQQGILKQQRAFAEDAAKQVLSSLTSQFRSRYHSHAAIIGHVDAISEHLLANVDMLIALGAEESGPSSNRK